MNLRQSWWILLVLGCALLGMPAVSSAQHSIGEQVRTLNADGLQAFGEGRFEDAANLFDRAYSLDPNPALLKNQAIAWYKAENCEKAVDAAHQFLSSAAASEAEAREAQALIGACKVRLAKEALDVESVDLAERLLDEVEAMEPDEALRDRISVVRVQIAKARAADREDETPEEREKERARLEALVALDDPELELSTFQAESVEIVEDPPPPPPEPAPTPVAGYALAATGGVLLLTGIVYHIVTATSAQSEFRRVAEEGVDRERYDQLDRRLRTANVLVPALYAGGAVATGVGVYLLVRPRGAMPESQTVAFGIGGQW